MPSTLLFVRMAPLGDPGVGRLSGPRCILPALLEQSERGVGGPQRTARLALRDKLGIIAVACSPSGDDTHRVRLDLEKLGLHGGVDVTDLEQEWWKGQSKPAEWWVAGFGWKPARPPLSASKPRTPTHHSSTLAKKGVPIITRICRTKFQTEHGDERRRDEAGRGWAARTCDGTQPVVETVLGAEAMPDVRHSAHGASISVMLRTSAGPWIRPRHTRLPQLAVQAWMHL